MLENAMTVGPYYPDPTLDDDYETCDGCDERFHEDDMKRWAGLERRCPDCCFLCPECRDAHVLGEDEFCWECAHEALGVKL